ncbi:hypothetical protein [Mucilaginibacter sp.]|uniref:hypothetical protein n=1 Tax=Mucilaginibacter sp. TaxID=1882438 RepID=UPI003D10AF11
MKKILLLFLLLFTILVAIALIPFNEEIAVKINASYFNCFQQVVNAKGWQKWHPVISKSFIRDSALYKATPVAQGFKFSLPDGYFLVKHLYSNTILVNSMLANNNFNYSYTIIPDSIGLSTTIIVNFKSNIIKHFFTALKKSGLNKTGIRDFKHYMEDPKLYYGFNIREGFLDEKKIIVKRKTFLSKELFTQAFEMEQQLNSYILLKHLKQTGPLMVQYLNKQNDSVQMMVGMPVDAAIVSDNDFLYMKIPATKVLMADFKGKYFDRQKVYTAIGKYIQDKYFHVKIAPFEIFEGKFPAQGSDMADFKLTYPVF